MAFFRDWGWVGVDLFLVLSAFLITSLLLIEHEGSGRISLRDFYVRRILRIWPLYYWTLLIAFAILPWLGVFGPKWSEPSYSVMVRTYLVPYATLFGNYAVGLRSYPPTWTLAHLWTITLEEQFYLFWPLLMAVLLRKNRKWLWGSLLLLLTLSVGLRWGLGANYPHPMVWTNTFARLDPLLVGIGLAFYRRKRPLSPRYSAALAKFGVGCLLIASIAWGPSIGTQSKHILWQYMATAVGFGFIVESAVCTATGPLTYLLTSRPLVWLGRLCYGLYVYHTLGIQIGADTLADNWLGRLAAPAPGLVWSVRFGVALSATIGLAAVSFYGFERCFLRLKDKFTHVRSRADGATDDPSVPSAPPIVLRACQGFSGAVLSRWRALARLAR